MTTQSLSDRLTTLSESNKTTVQLIQRLSKLSFDPAHPSPDGSEDAHVELSSDINDSLKQQEEDFELVKQEIEWLESGIASRGRRRESERDRERTRLDVQAAKLEEDLKHTRSAFRRAQLQAKRNADLSKRREREIRLAPIQEGSSTSPADHQGQHGQQVHHRGQGRYQEDPEVEASGDVTAALRRTHQLLENELSRSTFAQETLDETSKALEELSEHYSGLDSLLSSSRNLLGSLLRTQKSDTWYLETAFWLLVTTIIWLLFRRLLWGPFWWFVWLPTKLVYRIVFAVLGATGLVGSSKGVGAHTSGSVSTRTPLIIKPSASGKPPPRQNMGSGGKGIPVGGGGAGAKQAEGPLSEQVGQMAEESRQHQGEQNEPVKRGDGQPLQESDAPRNPKKRMYEEKVDDTRKRDEL